MVCIIEIMIQPISEERLFLLFNETLLSIEFWEVYRFY